MAKSVRLESELENKLEEAARALRISHSEFIRGAVERRCDEVLGRTLADDIGDLVGTVKSSGGRADESRKAFGQILKKKQR